MIEVDREHHMAGRRGAHWVVDKHINISVIFAIFAQFVGLIIWGTQLTSRVSDMEIKVNGMVPNVERLVRVETLSEGLRDGLKEIKVLLGPRYETAIQVSSPPAPRRRAGSAAGRPPA